MCHGRLSGTGRANDGNGFAFLYVDRDILEDWNVGSLRVGEGYIVE
jgi:hypothetical protein